MLVCHIYSRHAVYECSTVFHVHTRGATTRCPPATRSQWQHVPAHWRCVRAPMMMMAYVKCTNTLAHTHVMYTDYAKVHFVWLQNYCKHQVEYMRLYSIYSRTYISHNQRQCFLRGTGLHSHMWDVCARISARILVFVCMNTRAQVHAFSPQKCTHIKHKYPHDYGHFVKCCIWITRKHMTQTCYS